MIACMTSQLRPSFDAVAFFAADHADAVNGKVYVNGGFWNKLSYPQYPAVVATMSLVAVIRIPFREYQEDHRFLLGMVDADGNALPLKVEGQFRVGASPDLRRGDPTLMPLAIPVSGLRIEAPGDYSFTLSVDGTELARYQVRAIQIATPLRFEIEDG